MPRMVVGLVKSVDRTSTANAEDNEVAGLLAQAEDIIRNPDAFLPSPVALDAVAA